MPPKRDLGAYLRQVPLFAGLDDGSLALLTERSRSRSFAAHEALFHEGDPGFTLYVIVTGYVNVQRINELGQTVAVARRGPGEYIGELSLVDESPRSADVVTDTACDLLMLDRSAFDECLDRSPAMARSLLQVLAARLREATDTVDNNRTRDVMGRLCACLIDLACTSGEELANGAVRISIRVTQQNLADRIGATRETVNRNLATLKQMKALRSHEGRLIVVDMQRLRRYADN